MDTKEIPDLYRTTIHLLWDHKQQLFQVLEDYTNALKTDEIPDGEVASKLAHERLIPLIGEPKIDEYAKEYPGEFHEIAAQVGIAVTKVEAMKTYIYQVVRAIIRRWDNRFHMMPDTMLLCVQETLEYLGRQDVSKEVRVYYMKRAREDFFAFYKDDLKVAKERGYYDWIISNDAVEVYLGYFYVEPGTGLSCTQDAYHWAWDELTRHLEKQWGLGDDQIPF